MAKLEGVKTLDMVNGEITKIEYDGAVYEKSEDVARVGDLVRSLVEALDITKGGFYEVVRTYNDGDVRVKDDVDAGHDRLKSTVGIFRKVSETASPTLEQIGDRLDDIDADVYALAERVDALENGGEQSKESTETITFEGAKYTLVDRKAQPGDVVYVTEDADYTADIPNGKYYRVNVDGEIGERGWKHGVYRDLHNRTPDTVKVYEPIAESTSNLKEGVHVKALTDGQFYDVKAGEVGEITEIIYYDGYGIRVDTDDNFDYFRPQDLELVENKPHKPSEGDIVVITANTNDSSNKVGDIGVAQYIGDREYPLVNVPGRKQGVGYNITLLDEMRPATDEEKAKYKQAVKLVKLGGRKPGEYKIGDIVRVIDNLSSNLTEGDIYEINGMVDGLELVDDWAAEFELIAPVESRVDNVE